MHQKCRGTKTILPKR